MTAKAATTELLKAATAEEVERGAAFSPFDHGDDGVSDAEVKTGIRQRFSALADEVRRARRTRSRATLLRVLSGVACCLGIAFVVAGAVVWSGGERARHNGWVHWRCSLRDGWIREVAVAAAEFAVSAAENSSALDNSSLPAAASAAAAAAHVSGPSCVFFSVLPVPALAVSGSREACAVPARFSNHEITSAPACAQPGEVVPVHVQQWIARARAAAVEAGLTVAAGCSGATNASGCAVEAAVDAQLNDSAAAMVMCAVPRAEPYVNADQCAAAALLNDAPAALWRAFDRPLVYLLTSPDEIAYIADRATNVQRNVGIVLLVIGCVVCALWCAANANSSASRVARTWRRARTWHHERECALDKAY